jgi:hypothetical protein
MKRIAYGKCGKSGRTFEKGLHESSDASSAELVWLDYSAYLKIRAAKKLCAKEASHPIWSVFSDCGTENHDQDQNEGDRGPKKFIFQNEISKKEFRKSKIVPNSTKIFLGPSTRLRLLAVNKPQLYAGPLGPWSIQSDDTKKPRLCDLGFLFFSFRKNFLDLDL